MKIKDRAETSVGSGLIQDVVFMWEKSDEIRMPFENQQDVDIVWFIFTRYQTSRQQHTVHPPARSHFVNKLTHGGEQPRPSI